MKTKNEAEETRMPGQPVGSDDSSLQTYVNDTARALAARPKVRIRIPLPQGMTRDQAAKLDRWPCEVVGINGYNYQIKMGEAVEVPDHVAEILEKANKI